MAESPSSPSSSSPPARIAAVGLAVADLGRSAEFYKAVFGLVEQMTLTLPHMDEVILGPPGGRGASIALMHYTNGNEPTAAGDPVKVAFYVPDPVATAAAVTAAGGRVVMPPEPVASLGGKVLGFAKDPDNHLLELLEP